MDEDLPAGPFGNWLIELLASLRGEGGTDVPCDGCTACCTSSQFVHIAPDEHDTLAQVPRELLFPAPGAPAGHVLLGYDEQGRCPMLGERGCTIYHHRPRTCRTYDCRVFPAAGLLPTEAGKEAVAERARRWRFDHPGPGDRSAHDAVRAAARYLAEHPEALPGGVVPPTTQLAVAAVACHELFLDGEAGDGRRAEPGTDEVGVVLRQRLRARG